MTGYQFTPIDWRRALVTTDITIKVIYNFEGLGTDLTDEQVSKIVNLYAGMSNALRRLAIEQRTDFALTDEDWRTSERINRLYKDAQ